MKIYLRQIPPEGLVIEKTLPPETLDLIDKDLQVLSPVALVVTANKAGDELVLNIKAAATYKLSCGRCLEEVEVSRKDQFDIYRDIEPSTEYVDVKDDIREELILAITTVVFICKEDCRGICPNCGRNLNTEKCACPKEMKSRVSVHSDDEPEDKPVRIKI